MTGESDLIPLLENDKQNEGGTTKRSKDCHWFHYFTFGLVEWKEGRCLLSKCTHKPISVSQEGSQVLKNVPEHRQIEKRSKLRTCRRENRQRPGNKWEEEFTQYKNRRCSKNGYVREMNYTKRKEKGKIGSIEEG